VTDLDGGASGGEVVARRRSRSPIAIALVVLVAIIAAGVAVAVTRGDDGPKHPEAWDPRVSELVSFVERERGHRFEHPIEVAFLSDADFRARVTSHDELTADDREELEQLSGAVRALGLAEGKLDLLDAIDQLQGEAVIGLYDPETDSITIRGDKVLPSMRPTVVHELTHALQDQVFGLQPDTDTSGEGLAFSALRESDALRIEDAYTQSLSDEERAAIDESDRKAADEVDLEGVPEFLTELFTTPYSLGPAWLEIVIGDEGNKAVDAVFRRLPVSEEQIVDPEAYVSNDVPDEVDTPKLRSGEESLDEGDFGMLSLLLVLGERLPYDVAWKAVDGWEGDAEVTFEADRRTCIRLDVATETSDDQDELVSAFQLWSKASPRASVERVGDLAELSSCDPGAEAKRPASTGPRAFEILLIQRGIIGALRSGGVDVGVAECAVARLTAGAGAQALHDLNQIEDASDPRMVAIQTQLRDAVGACAAG
jgi:hypothetical protein